MYSENGNREMLGTQYGFMLAAVCKLARRKL
jgi:hypothetical protein